MVPEGEELWFSVLSDFFPHGAVADRYGILRSDGVAERGVFVIDKAGVIRYIDVHDINDRPSLENLVKELEKLK
jgi:alkyl hydroperoxide reductase subunit AhpC